MTAPAVWFVYHVTKTGGQTIRNHLRGALGPSAHLHLGRWDPDDEPVGAEVLADRDLEDVRVVTGHRVVRSLMPAFSPRPVNDVLVLRHPGDRIVSHWRHNNHRRGLQGREPLTFDEFSTSRGTEPMVREVARRIPGERRRRRMLDAALHALTTVRFVTVVEDLDLVLPRLLEAMGLPGEVPPRANRAGIDYPADDPPDGAEVAAWVARNPGDLVLYRAARERTASTLRLLAGSGP